MDLLMIAGSRLLLEEVQKKEVDGEGEHGCDGGGFLIITSCKRAGMVPVIQPDNGLYLFIIKAGILLSARISFCFFPLLYYTSFLNLLPVESLIWAMWTKGLCEESLLVGISAMPYPGWTI
ncbi:hypothetical protein E3N88_25431 [Mikania micrantha]|uniref:Uncharacterized protein n=1 Tax=Mikania micrantha TaxID=192012 RepID=A0A5N6N678_9ASTR|nr:hypothetical protein E3N88_25431 [Mikania micrantha]